MATLEKFPNQWERHPDFSAQLLTQLLAPLSSSEVALATLLGAERSGEATQSQIAQLSQEKQLFGAVLQCFVAVARAAHTNGLHIPPSTVDAAMLCVARASFHIGTHDITFSGQACSLMTVLLENGCGDGGRASTPASASVPAPASPPTFTAQVPRLLALCAGLCGGQGASEAAAALVGPQEARTLLQGARTTIQLRPATLAALCELVGACVKTGECVRACSR